ncbi:hypothetical protein A2164_01685 [Candidatus Curtissbacteria bacterium RBG_13_35_7]|uniref:Dienelactone hydrolase domain-containing protein n=1 Tax=Candidatus Curtissbacteria bacterium RBG_13_35_7 TaxID=1797705 RepID=A0A1F5G051_9BACT|nr:MAG: hypothetical protein A2164_01685 [Candidatus Curtissbacteria bacterium RBG_13_35_7]
MKFWKKALLTNLKIISIIIGIFIIFFLTPFGKPFSKTLLLVPEVIPRFPIRPLNYLSREPQIQTIEFVSGERKIIADIYRLRDNKKHPAIVISLGVLATSDNSDLVKLAKAFSRLGYVVVIPEFPDLISGFVWTDSVEILVSSAEYLSKQDYIDKKRIGFAGFCVGGSVAIVAASQPQISEKIAFVGAISPYYDAYLTAQVSVMQKQKDIQGKYIEWNPASLTINTLIKQFTNVIITPNEKELVFELLMNNRQMSQETYQQLSIQSQRIYDFFNKGGSVDLAYLPDDLQRVMRDISPKTFISGFKAKLLLLNDKNDTFVPRSEVLALVNNISNDKLLFVEVDSFEHVNPKTNLPRLAILKQLWHVGYYVYNMISIIE